MAYVWLGGFPMFTARSPTEERTMAPKAHWLTRAQALKALGLEKATAAELLAIEQKAPDSTQGKVARHLRKWLPNDDSKTTIPLEDAEAKALKLTPVEPAAK